MALIADQQGKSVVLSDLPDGCVPGGPSLGSPANLLDGVRLGPHTNKRSKLSFERLLVMSSRLGPSGLNQFLRVPHGWWKSTKATLLYIEPDPDDGERPCQLEG